MADDHVQEAYPFFPGQGPETVAQVKVRVRGGGANKVHDHEQCMCRTGEQLLTCGGRDAAARKNPLQDRLCPVQEGGWMYGLHAHVLGEKFRSRTYRTAVSGYQRTARGSIQWCP